MPIQSKDGININVNAKGEAKIEGLDKVVGDALRLNDTLKEVANTLSTMARGNNVGKYWDEQYKSIERVKIAYDNFRLDMEKSAARGVSPSTGLAEELTKTINAFSAHTGNNIRDFFDQLGDGASAVVAKAKEMSMALDSAFDKSSLETSFKALDSLRDAGDDVQGIIDKLSSANASEYISQIEKLRRKSVDLEIEIDNLRGQLSLVGDSGDLQGLIDRVDTLERSIRNIRSTAEIEFSNFLSANRIDPDFGGAYEYFERIRDGSMTANDAIAAFKANFSHMFEGGISNSASEIFSLLNKIYAQLESIPNALKDAITSMREMHDIADTSREGADAIRAESNELRDMADSANNIKPIVESLSQISDTAKGMSGDLSASTAGIKDLISELAKLGSIDNSRLTNISIMLRSIAEINGFTASSKGLSSVVDTLQRLSEFKDTRSLVTLSGLDFTKLKVSKAALENLSNYLPQISKVDVTPLERLASINWSNLEGLKISKANLENVTRLVEQSGIKQSIDSKGDGLGSIETQIQNIHSALNGLRGVIDQTFDLSNAIKQADNLAKSYEAVAASMKAVSSAKKEAKSSEDRSGESKELKELVALYQQYYALESKKIAAVASGNIENADMFRNRAAEIWETINAIEQLDPELAKLAGSHEKVTEAVRKWQEAANSGQAASDSAMMKRMKAEAAELDKLQAQLDRLGLGAGGIKFGGDVTSVERYKEALLQAQQALDQIGSKTGEERAEAVSNFNSIIAEVQKLRDSLNNSFSQGQTDTSLTRRIETMKSQWISFTNANNKWYLQNKDAYDEIFTELSQGASIGAQRVTELQTRMTSLNSQMKTAGASGKTFFQQMKEGWQRFGGWSIVTRSFTKVISTFKEMVTAVKEVDAAMTELRKVTDLTSAGYDDFYKTAVNMATEVGAKLSDTINAAADFSRLGYNIVDAASLAEAALVYQNVGDSIEDISEATSSLISTMKAFGIEASDSMSIVDMFNEVGKKLLPIPAVTRCLAECYIGQSSVGLCA